MRGEQPWRTNRSRVLCSHSISAEAKLWSRLRNGELGGHKFVRQMPIDPHFVDFVCRERKVVVEVDGGTRSTHAELAHDVRRARHLESLGYRVFRIANHDVYNNLDCTLDALSPSSRPRVERIGACGCPSLQPSPRRRGEGVRLPHSPASASPGARRANTSR